MIVFDLDDTLYKEKEYVESGKKEVNKTLRFLFPGLSLQELDDLEWTETEKSIYRQHKPEIALEPESIAALNSIKNSGIEMAIITDGRAVQQRNKFEALGLKSFIPEDRLLISEEIGEEKTNPRSFLILMEMFPYEVKWMYVGDNPKKDFVIANKLGWTTVMLKDKKNVNVHSQDLSGELPTEYYPDFSVDSLTEILNIYLYETSKH